jgi:hypothetical protein
LVVAGCTSGHDTSLRIAIDYGDKHPVYQLSCDPPGGTVPRPKALCGLISKNSDTMLSPPNTHQVCGAYLVPFIHVFGRYRGRSVKAEVSSCYGLPKTETLWLRFIPLAPAS